MTRRVVYDCYAGKTAILGMIGLSGHAFPAVAKGPPGSGRQEKFSALDT